LILALWPYKAGLRQARGRLAYQAETFHKVNAGFGEARPATWIFAVFIEFDAQESMFATYKLNGTKPKEPTPIIRDLCRKTLLARARRRLRQSIFAACVSFAT